VINVTGDVLKNELLMYLNCTADFSSKSNDPKSENSVTLRTVPITTTNPTEKTQKTITTLGNML